MLQQSASNGVVSHPDANGFFLLIQQPLWYFFGAFENKRVRSWGIIFNHPEHLVIDSSIGRKLRKIAAQ